MRVAVFLALLGCASLSLGAYPTQTNSAYNNFNTCDSKIQSDVDCVNQVKASLEKLSDYIQKVRNLKNNMVKIRNGLNTLSLALGLAKYLPTVGAAINVLKNTINIAKQPFSRATDRVIQIDGKIWPYKDDVDKGIAHCDQVIAKLEWMQDKCVKGRTAIGAARSCVNAMGGHSLKTGLASSLEVLAGAVNGPIRNMNNALGNIGGACSAIRRITNIIKGWPNIDGIINGLNGFYNKMKPILDFFGEIQRFLNRRFCAKDPFEIGREDLSRRVRVPPIRIPPVRLPRIRVRSFKKRKRSVEISKREANNLLAISKRGSICFSAQQILDGINGVFNVLEDLVNKALKPILNRLPSFNLPGLPSFGGLFRLNINFRLPSINFNLNFGFFDFFKNMNFACATQVKNVCAARGGLVTFNCATPF